MRTSIRRGLCALALTGGLSVAGVALASTAQAASGDATNVPGSSTSGKDGLLSGNQTGLEVEIPVEVSGNQVAVIGEENSSGGRDGAGSGAGDGDGSGDGDGDGPGDGDDGSGSDDPDPNQSGSGGPNDGNGGADGTDGGRADDGTVAGAEGERSAGPSRAGTREVAGVSAGTPGPAGGAGSVLPNTGSPVGPLGLGGALVLLLTGLVLLGRSRREEAA